jgi:hypothetical protein
MGNAGPAKAGGSINSEFVKTVLSANVWRAFYYDIEYRNGGDNLEQNLISLYLLRV